MLFYIFISVIISACPKIIMRGSIMANDVIFKKRAFGGYDKDSVLEYVNGILNEKSDLEMRLAANTDNTAKLNMKIHELEGQVSEREKLDAEMAELKNKVEELTALVEEKEALINEKDEELATQRSALSAALDNTADSDELEALKAENLRLKAECERKKDLERQVGAAMLDARVHSEELVEAAKQRADSATRSVYNAIGETAVKIDDLSSGIAEIARSFTKSVEEVELRIKVLTGDMSKTAQALISETSSAADAVSAEISYTNEPETVSFVADDEQ